MVLASCVGYINVLICTDSGATESERVSFNFL